MVLGHVGLVIVLDARMVEWLLPEDSDKSSTCLQGRGAENQARASGDRLSFDRGLPETPQHHQKYSMASISNGLALYLRFPRAIINPLRMKNVRQLRSSCAERVVSVYAAQRQLTPCSRPYKMTSKKKEEHIDSDWELSSA